MKRFPLRTEIRAQSRWVNGGLLLQGTGNQLFEERPETFAPFQKSFIVIGGILPMLGGSMLGFLSYPDVFFEFELGGTVFLFLGFRLSARYIARRDGAKAAEAKTPL